MSNQRQGDNIITLPERGNSVADTIKAGVVVVTKFVSSESKKFRAYINYIDRDEAVREQHLEDYAIQELKKEVPGFGRYMDYVGNPEKASALFTADKDRLTPEEKDKLKKIFSCAQEKGSLMWQTVISFDNRWLAEQGLYDEETHIVDTKKLQEYTRGCMSRMLKKEDMSDSAVWSAAIHYNTDNIHIHIATVEPVPTRKKMTEGPYAGQARGKFKQSSIEAGKSYVVNQILQTAEQNQKINQIVRQNMLQGKRDRPLIEDKKFCKDFLRLYHALPANRQLWKYNMTALDHLRPQIDNLTRGYIEKYHGEDYKELTKLLKEQEEKQAVAYGRKSRGGYAENKIQDLYTRMGNTILKEALRYDRDAQRTVRQTVMEKGKQISSGRARRPGGLAMAAADLKRAMYYLKGSLKSDYEQYRNQQIYEREIEQGDLER